MSLKLKNPPANVDDWRRLARNCDATGGMEELGSPIKVSSASRFDHINFLGLQVLYDMPLDMPSRVPDAITRQFRSSPNNRLRDIPGYTAYLNEVEKARRNRITKASIAQDSVPLNLGAFMSTWQFQRHVIVGDKIFAEMPKISMVRPTTPVAKRTRAQIRARLVEQAATPTPAPKFKSMSLAKQIADLSLQSKGRTDDDGAGDPLDLGVDASGDGLIEPVEDSSHRDDEQEEDEAANIEEQEIAVGDLKDRVYSPMQESNGHFIRDEQTVNVFLLVFLSAITAGTAPFHTRWVAERNAMIFKRNVEYVARTDGQLRNDNGRCFSLIEVKPRKRGADISIRIQESAQMAAWIAANRVESHDPDSNCEMFLLSQDKDEIFITFPYFGKDYGKPWKDMKDLKAKDFLRMREYGPFKLNSKEHVNHIAEFLRNYTLHKSRC